MTVDQIFQWIIQHQNDNAPQFEIIWKSAAQTLLLLNFRVNEVKELAKLKKVELYDPQEYDQTQLLKQNNFEHEQLIRTIGKTVQSVCQNQ